jgi:AcrR family transcriptional regulator
MGNTRQPRQARSRATVDSIVEAGFICVSTYGVKGVTTNHIAEVAGISIGSLYEYFANKEMIFTAMQERFVADAVATLQPQIPAITRMTVAEAMQTLFMGLKEFLSLNNERYLKFTRVALAMETRHLEEPISRVLSEVITTYVLHNYGGMRVRNLPAMIYILVNGSFHVILRYLSEPNPLISFEELTQGFVDMMRNYVAQEKWLTKMADAEPVPERPGRLQPLN